MAAKEGGHFLGFPHCKEMMAKPVVDATLDGGGNNQWGTSKKKEPGHNVQIVFFGPRTKWS